MSRVTIDRQCGSFWKLITFFFGFNYFVLSLYYRHFYLAVVSGGIVALLILLNYCQSMQSKKATPDTTPCTDWIPKAKPEQTQKWIPFFFDGNLYFNMVETPEDWAQCLEIYVTNHSTKEDLLEAKRCPRIKEYPRFGFYMEYTGPETLGEWAAKEGMTL